MKQWFSFCCIGVVGFMVDSSILLVLINFFKFPPILARFFSFFLAAMVTWWLNRTFTFFSARTQRTLFNEWICYFSANSTGMVLNFSIFTILILYSQAMLHFPLIAVAFGSIGGLFFNFFASKHFVFRRHSASMSDRTSEECMDASDPDPDDFIKNFE